jgi:hypothetical protein
MQGADELQACLEARPYLSTNTRVRLAHPQDADVDVSILCRLVSTYHAIRLNYVIMGETVKKIPQLELAESQFLWGLPEDTVPEKESLKARILQLVKQDGRKGIG